MGIPKHSGKSVYGNVINIHNIISNTHLLGFCADKIS